MQTSTVLQHMQPSYIREILHCASDPNVISFAGGLPDSNSFATHLMRQPLQDMHLHAHLFQYANTQGYEPFIQYCADFYNLQETESLIVCNGSQQGLDLIARAFINAGDTVLMQAPSYLGAVQVFTLAQANIVNIDSLGNDLDLEQLERSFSTQQVKLFYAVPDFHNPTGACWSLATRKSVAKLCLKYHVTLIEDAPYRELRFAIEEQLPLVSSFCPERSLTLRSFSKFIAPGIRIGLVMGPSEWIQALIKIKQSADLHTNTPMQALLLSVLSNPDLAAHMQRIRQRYYQRYLQMSRLITKNLPKQCQFNPVKGGMFIWLQVPGNNSHEIARNALANGLAVVPSAVFYPAKAANNNALRLNFTHSSSDDMHEGIKRLAQVIESQ